MTLRISIKGLPAGELTVEDYLLEYRPDSNTASIQVRVNGAWYPVTLDDKQEFLIIASILQSGRVTITANGTLQGRTA